MVVKSPLGMYPPRPLGTPLLEGNLGIVLLFQHGNLAIIIPLLREGCPKGGVGFKALCEVG